MNDRDDRERYADGLVRAHLDRQAASVDAAAFLARVRSARHHRLLGAVAAAAFAAGMIIALVIVHSRPEPVKVPSASEIAKIVQPSRDAVVSSALTGLSATGRCITRAVEAGSAIPFTPPPLPAFDRQSLEDLRSDANQLTRNLRAILDQALADAGLKS